MMDGPLHEKLWDLSEVFLDLHSISATVVCCVCCELPASRYFSALGATAYFLYFCAQLSQGVPHVKFPHTHIRARTHFVFAFPIERMF